MTRTGDQAFIKELNKSIVLNLFRVNSPISRTQVSTKTGLNKATVTSIMDELIAEGLVMEVGPGHSQVGRRPVLLRLNSSAGFAIGIDVGVHNVRVLTVNLSGDMIRVTEYEHVDMSNVKVASRFLVDCIDQEIAQIPPSPLGVLGVGIGLPGMVDYARGHVANAPNLGWVDVALKSLLEMDVHLPIFIDNEANTGALGESLFGVGKHVRNLVYVSVGTGLGTGIIVDGELLRGTEGIAGEFGHTTIEVKGLKCSCGNQGCLEMYASEKALVERYQQASGERLSPEAIFERLTQGDRDAVSALQTVAHYLGVGVANMVNVLNPSLVLIGSRLADSGDILLQAVRDSLSARSITKRNSHVSVELSSLRRDACAIGAASLVLHEYFSLPKTTL